MLSGVWPALSFGMIIPIFWLFIVAHEIANLFPMLFKGNFENRSGGLLGGEHFSPKLPCAECMNSRDNFAQKGVDSPEVTNQGISDTVGVVKQLVAFVIHQILYRSAPCDAQRVTIEIGE